MGSTKAGEASAPSETRETQDSDVAASGVREGERERETTPAPANVDASITDEWDSLASDRPTEVPRYDVVAHAYETSLRHSPLPPLPHEASVPTRSDRPPPADLELRAAFVLLHVDGRSSITEIAELTAIPVDEVLATFLGLTAVGLVSLS